MSKLTVSSTTEQTESSKHKITAQDCTTGFTITLTL